MDIHEYQAKKLLAEFGVVIPRGGIAYSPEMLKIKLEKLVDLNGLLKHKYIQEQEVRLVELFYVTLL